MAGLIVPHFHIGKAKPKLSDEIIGHGDYRYRVHKHWGDLDFSKYPVNNCHEMVMDSKGRLIMIGDEYKNNILIYDKSGKLLDAWGTSHPGGHGLSIHNEGGEDFLYLADAGWHINHKGQNVRNAGRITKTTTDGRVIFDIGHPQTIGVYDPSDPFCPTETAIGPNGDIYIADGYGKSTILQYDAQGRFIRMWGGTENEDENYNLHTAHGVTIDYRDPDLPLLAVSSRADNVFKFFTLEGQYVRTLHLPNMYVCRAVFDDDVMYAGVCWSVPEKETEFDWQAHTGFMTVLEGDQVVSNPGGTPPHYVDGALQKSYQLDTKPIWHGHDVCIDEDKNVYVCQWNAEKSYPIKLERL